jgi:hypothetical protein
MMQGAQCATSCPINFQKLWQNLSLSKNVILSEAMNLVFLITLDSVQDDSEIRFCNSF